MRGRSLAEVSLVFALFQLVRLFLPGVGSLFLWETRVLGWSYFTGFLMLLLPLLAVMVWKRDYEEYGLTLRRWRSSVDVGLKGYLYLIVPQVLLTFGTAWGFGYRYAVGSLFLSGVVFIFLFLLLRRLTGKGYKEFKGPGVRVAIVAALLTLPLAAGLLARRFTLKLLSTVVWQFLFGGVAEEVLYRGYIQSAVNEEYGRPWRFVGVEFGPGLLASSVLYGLHRALNTVKPWAGVYEVSLGWGLFAFTFGVFYGFLREHTGDVVGSGVANGLMDAVGESVLRLLR
ncbi:CPBP family intramembrane metalloprotease [Candidatus Bathyarchaeota archaeon]|nr:CPBP family intramembrane metalloprotease [Candidatus Bathyarchaeota archaeon]